MPRPGTWPRPSSFNGAALGRARRFRKLSQKPDLLLSLQRGRARESAEIRFGAVDQVALGRRFNGAALGRARRCSGPDEGRLQRRVASTGPRSGERGDYLTMPDKVKENILLQRGRARESAEMTQEETDAQEARLLQRGRARESAEIGYQATAPSTDRPCFNGAALGRARRLVGLQNRETPRL